MNEVRRLHYRFAAVIKGDNLVDSSAPRWDDGRRVWSLWDIMNAFNFHEFMDWINIISSHRCLLHANEREGKGGEVMEEVPRLLIRDRIAKFSLFFDNSGLTDCRKVCSQYVDMFSNSRLVQAGAKAHLDGLIAALQREFAKISMLRVEASLAKFLDTDVILGEGVSRAFPTAAPDIKEAGNCLAADCNTAAVFHLMRVAEYGLRALARDRKIELPRQGPIELSTWEEVIRELEKVEAAVTGYPRTEARESQLTFLHGAMLSLRAFKNAVRNPVMHTRESFDHHQALSILNHVKEFMNRLQQYVDEQTTDSPQQWTSEWITSRSQEILLRRSNV
jgi:hypothetical protein